MSAGGSSGTLTVLTTAPVTASASTTAPTGGVTALAKRRITTLATGTPLLYVTVTASNATAFLSGASGTFTLASAPTAPVFLAYWTGSEWDNVSDTAATVSGTSVSFTYSFSASVAANPNAYFALYETGSSPLPMMSASPSPSPLPSHAPSPSPSPAGTPFVDTACTQTPAPTQPAGITNVASTFFSSGGIVESATTICLSAWDISNNIATALEYAASHGANVTVITPYSENGSNSSYLNAIIAAGGHAKTEYTTSSGKGNASPTTTEYQLAPMDIHAKFALIDGIAYMDGHNWFTTDVILQDPVAADFSAIQSDLVNLATPAPSGAGGFTTDKQLSLQTESNYLQQTAIPALSTGAATEFDFVTESFNPTSGYAGEYEDDVYDGMCQIASLPAQPTMKVIVEDLNVPSTAETQLQNLLLLDPHATVYSSPYGEEKISMIRATVNGPVTNAWFGSSNTTGYDLFDWGTIIPSTNTNVLSGLQAYYSYALTGNVNPIPSPSPGMTPTACASPHP